MFVLKCISSRWMIEYKVKFLQRKTTFVDMSVDGDIDGRAARIVRDAGADVLVASASLFSRGCWLSFKHNC